jgi:hypothetical protein
MLTTQQQRFLLVGKRVGCHTGKEAIQRVGHPSLEEWIVIDTSFILQIGISRHINVFIRCQIDHAQLCVVD